MSIPSGLEVVTSQASKDAILAAPEIARRLVSMPVNVNNPQNYFLREADGPAVIAKRGLRDYIVLAPSLEAANPHVHRLIDWVFFTTDALALWFDTENGLGAELGADPVGNWSKLTRDKDGRIAPVMFATWRLSVEPRIEHHDPIRIEGGRQRRALIKAGAAWNVRDRDKEGLDRRLGFLSLTATGGQAAKGIAAYDDFAVMRGLRAIRVLASRPVIEFEIFGVRVRIIDGKLEMAAGSA